MNLQLNLSLLCIVGLCLQVKAVSDLEAAEKFKQFVLDCHLTLSKDHMFDIIQLREFVNRFNDGHNTNIPSSPIATFAIQHAILYLMRNRQENFEHSRAGRLEYETKFDKHVLGTCSAIKSQLDPNIAEYHHLMENKETLRYLDADALDWIANSRICLEILQGPSLFRKQGYEDAIGQHLHKTKITRAFHRLAKYV